MNLSVISFKIKRIFGEVRELFLDTFRMVLAFFKRIVSNPRTEQAGAKIKKTKERVLKNFRDNADNWKRRNIDDHGFLINDEDI